MAGEYPRVSRDWARSRTLRGRSSNVRRCARDGGRQHRFSHPLHDLRAQGRPQRARSHRLRLATARSRTDRQQEHRHGRPRSADAVCSSAFWSSAPTIGPGTSAAGAGAARRAMSRLFAHLGGRRKDRRRDRRAPIRHFSPKARPAPSALKPSPDLHGLAYGHPNKKTALRLGLALPTASRHVSGILRVLGVTNPSRAILLMRGTNAI
jgi:hypothetical protein